MKGNLQLQALPASPPGIHWEAGLVKRQMSAHSGIRTLVVQPVVSHFNG